MLWTELVSGQASNRKCQFTLFANDVYLTTTNKQHKQEEINRLNININKRKLLTKDSEMEEWIKIVRIEEIEEFYYLTRTAFNTLNRE